MTDTIKVKLITALKAVGMSEGVADGFADQDDAAVEKFIASITPKPQPLNVEEMVKGADFQKWFKENGLDKLMTLDKGIQSQVDKKVGQGIKTTVTKLYGEEPVDPSKKKTVEEIIAEAGKGTGTGGDVDKDNPLYKMVESLAGTVQKLVDNQKSTTTQSTAKELLAKTKIPEKIQATWLTRVDPNSDTSVEDQVKALETEYKGIHESINGEGTYEFIQNQPKPGTGGKDKLTDADKEALVAGAKKI